MRDVRDLVTINTQVAHDYERRAVQSWRLNRQQRLWLERVIGFAKCDRLLAGNKSVRIETARQLARRMGRLYRAPGKHFYWITLIHDGWHASHNVTWIDLEDITMRVGKVLSSTDAHWFGMIEFDIFINYPGRKRCARVTPHAHLLLWTDEAVTAIEMKSYLHAGLLKSELGAPVVVVKRVRTWPQLLHYCYYMTKPNHRLKSLGQPNRDTGRMKTFPVETKARPSLILRLAEILSYVEIGELMLAHGEGQLLKDRILKSLTHRSVVSRNPRDAAGDVADTWASMSPAYRQDKLGVHVVRRD